MMTEATPLADSRTFKVVTGLWKGTRQPLVPATVVRSTNFRGDGLLDFDDAERFLVDSRQLSERHLEPGDVIVERSGGGPQQPVGRVALFVPPTGDAYATSNFTSAIRIIDRDSFDSAFVALFLHHWYLCGETEHLQRATTGIRNLDWPEYLKTEVPRIDKIEQEQIASAASFIRRSYEHESRAILELDSLKRAAMRELFTHGLRTEEQKESEVGTIPRSWNVVALGRLGRIGNGSTPKRPTREYWEGGTFPWLTSAKVYDREIVAADQFVTETALANCHLPKVKAGSVLIAITGQGKTLGHCAVLRFEATVNQHVAYVEVSPDMADPSYVRGYLETQYDYLRQVGSGGGSTKGALTCAFLRTLPIPLPPGPDLTEQREIVEILDAIDQKIDLHKRRKAVLEELFKALLHKLMTGEIRVADLDLSALDEAKPSGATA